jgi:serine/threonine protein kinase/tetratricopeptide (TPR) repeat protein
VAEDRSASIEQFRAALEPAYRLERVLGVGGTATVFLAEDRKHDRMVAVKVLHPELADTVGIDRFLRETRLAARLTHPHIVPLLDSGRAGNSPYFVMPFIEGDVLRARLDRGEHFTLDEAVTIITEVADALDYAHAAGIVHRDIKPENVLLLRGHAVVADFGIARAIRQATGELANTSTLLIVGTPAYMSPEQAAGDLEIDGRSDIYSLATTFFEMMSGAPPFSGASAQQLIARRFMEVAPRLSVQVVNLPAHVDDAVAAALAIEPKSRPETALAFARRLAMPRDATNTTPPGGTVPTGVSFRATTGVGVPSVPSIAVLPFANLSSDPENEFLSDGITEEIISTLSRMRTIRVAARASSFAFKDRRSDVRAIAAELGVSNVLDGSLRRSGNRVRVSAELVDARTGFQLWSERFDRAFDDAFAIQDEIARGIADALSATLMLNTGSMSRDAIDGPAYELYLRGRYSLNKRTEADLLAAEEHFSQAVALQPDYALALAGLADALLVQGIYGSRPAAEVMPKARAAADRALAVDPSLGEAHTTVGAIRALYDYDWAGAEESFRRATALTPRYPTAWQWRAMQLLVPRGRFVEARSSIDQARSLDPLSMAIATSVGVVEHLVGDIPAAARAFERAIEIDPAFAMSYYFLGGALRDAGEYAMAIESFGLAISKSGGTPEMTAGLAQAHALAGETDQARHLQRGLEAAAGARTVAWSLRAQVHASLGEIDAAVDALLMAADAREAEIVFIGVRQSYAPLHGDARFIELRARIGV